MFILTEPNEWVGDSPQYIFDCKQPRIGNVKYPKNKCDNDLHFFDISNIID